MITPFYPNSIQGAAMGAHQLQAEQKLRAEVQPQAIQGPYSPFESAVSRADASSQELAHILDVLESRLERVMEIQPTSGAAQNGCTQSSSAPIIRIIDELSERQMAAVQRVRSIMDRLAI